MLILILGLTLIAFVVFIKLAIKYKNRHSSMELTIWDLFVAMSVVFGIVSLILLIVFCCLVPKVATAGIFDDKIAMYQEENAIIEQDIDRIVAEYLKHEQDTFSDLKTEESSITLVTLFPELKSDTLVQQQLKIYVVNNEKIKSLKEEKIGLTKLKWILYFGK